MHRKLCVALGIVSLASLCFVADANISQKAAPLDSRKMFSGNAYSSAVFTDRKKDALISYTRIFNGKQEPISDTLIVQKLDMPEVMFAYVDDLGGRPDGRADKMFFSGLNKAYVRKGCTASEEDQFLVGDRIILEAKAKLGP